MPVVHISFTECPVLAKTVSSPNMMLFANQARCLEYRACPHDDSFNDLGRLAFDFFDWLSRFEFALKEVRNLKSIEEGAKAEVSWDMFIEKQRNAYQLNAVGLALIDAKPKCQIVGANGLDFRDVGFNAGVSDLEQVVRLANTVRNDPSTATSMAAIIGTNPTACATC